MSKWDKQLAKLRQNPKHVRFTDIENILLRLGFAKRQGSTSHAVFTLPGHEPIIIPKPHGSPFVTEAYVKKDLLPLLEALGVIEEE